MDIVLDRSRPLVDQIVDQMMGAIAAGEVPPGTRLPSIRALALTLGVNRNTVAHAIRELSDKGYVRTRYGGGSIAALPPRQPLARSVREGREGVGPDGGKGLSHFASSNFATSQAAMSQAATFSEVDWEQRFARRLDGFLSPTSAPLFPPGNGNPINLLQLRPNTTLFPLERFRQCLNTVLRRSGSNLLNYGTPAGYLPLREQIARRLRAAGIDAEPSQVLVISGSQQGIDLLARAFLDEGDPVVVESPTYSMALKIFSVHGARPYPYRVNRDGIDFSALRQLGRQQAPKLFYTVPNFQNPTTHSYSLEEKTHLLEEAYRLGSMVVEDASDHDLHGDPAQWPPLAALDRTGRTIHLNTFSKTLVPALRVGYLCAPPALVRRLSELKEMTDLSQSLVLQGAIAEFMERGYFDSHVEAVREAYRKHMANVLELLEAALPAEVPFTRPEGGLCVWVDLPGHVDTDRLFEHLRGRGLLVSPGSLYRPGQGGRNGIRLCVANEPPERLREGFAILGRELEQVLRQPPPTPAEQEYQPIH